MLYSASGVVAFQKYDSPFRFLRDQVRSLVIGMGLLVLASRIRPTCWIRWGPVLMVGAYVLLILVLIPGLGVKVNGAQRWLHLGGVSFQPSEVFKVAVVAYLAGYLVRRASRLSEAWWAPAPAWVVIGGGLGLLVLEPDLGTLGVVALVTTAMLFLGGATWGHLVFLGLLGLVGGGGLAYLLGYPWQRLQVYWDPWRDPLGGGFQTIQSLLAFGHGGLLGTGLGEGRQKLFFLPEAHTDYIYAVIAEETGLVGALLVLGLYGAFLARGILLVHRVEEMGLRYLGMGILLLFATEILVNLGVVTGLLPSTGLPLPLISYGGSSLMIHLLLVGILLALSQEAHGGAQGGLGWRRFAS